ncbi:MAG: hypothetical protein OIF34_11980 [Porticoccaceae bacterium]|nr:hypothetical protein [Porticoccaceae bacterium]
MDIFSFDLSRQPGFQQPDLKQSDESQKNTNVCPLILSVENHKPPTAGFRYCRATDKKAYSKGYLMAVAGRFQVGNISVINSASDGWNDSYDLANAADARAASDWMKGWLDGRDRLGK